MIISAICLGVTGGAVMALDEAVTHHALGVAAFAIALSISFIWIVSAIVSAFVSEYKSAKGGETGKMVEWLVMVGLGLASLIVTIVSLSIH